MFGKKISMTPIIPTVIVIFGLTIISCAATQDETSKQPHPTIAAADPAEPSLPPPGPSAKDTALDQESDDRIAKADLQSLPNPMKDPLIETNIDPPNRPAVTPSINTAVPPPVLFSDRQKGEGKKSYPAGSLPKLNPRESRDQQEEETERDIMDEALLLLDESQKYWVKGELEDALQMLDQAYALLLDTNGKPDIVRQKDDLRLMISKRILAIYGSLQSVAKGKRGEIPIITNADVEKEIRLFQTVERDFFISSYQRSMIYRPVIVRELRKAGLPEELSWLPLVESGYKINALSSARALGLWQFIPSTGYKYGLNRDDWADERMDVEKSTRAAIDYFKDLHAMFGDWLTVLAGYNCGEGRVMRTIASQHINYLDRFWDLYQRLPYETARYVPRFLATLLIVKDPPKYGMDLGPESPRTDILSYEITEVNRCMRLQDIAQKLDTSEETLCILNAELRHRMTPDRPYKLKVPTQKAEFLLQMLPEIPQADRPRASYGTISGVVINHKVRSGETVDSIARKYKTSAGAILSANHLSKKKRLVVGQKLNVPLGSSKMQAAVDKEINASKTIRYKVQKGDTLASISRKHGVPLADIRKVNNLSNDNLKVGQTLSLAETTNEKALGSLSDKKDDRAKKSAVASEAKPAGENSGSTASKKYTVKQGDSLNRIARENNMSLEKLITLNGLVPNDHIHPGQVILIE